MSDKPRLRVGLLLDSLKQPAWIRAMISDVRNSEVAEIVLLVLNDAEEPSRKPFAERLGAYRKALLYLLYMRLDERRSGGEANPFELSDLSDLLGGVATLRVKPRQTKHCDYFEDVDVRAIRQHDLDVAIRLGFRILRGSALQIARHGVWSYHHGDNTVNRGGPPGFWEVAEQQPVTGAVLQVLSDELDNGRVIYRSFSATNPYSVRDNRRAYYWKSSSFVGRKLRDLHARGEEGLVVPGGDGFHAYSKRLYQQPTNAEMLRFLPRLIGRYSTEKLRGIGTQQQWFVAYKFGKGEHKGIVPDGTLYNAKIIEPPLDRFWADPFPIYRDGQYHIFCEEYRYETRTAHIVVFSFDEKGQPGAPRVALKVDHHLSYPTLFEWRGELYMLPEAAESGKVQLYRCRQFPDQWEAANVLLEATPAADPTLAEIQGRWWLFVTLPSPGAQSWNDELHLFVADNPLGPWKPHAGNPVKSDVRGARPAGRVFSIGHRFYRPAQDCSVRYGFGITVHEITRITDTEYEEVPVSVIRPDWRPGLLGVHTINAAGRLTVTDGQWRRRRSPLASSL